MTIANPIYDAVFKYLMEDLEIAKDLLSTILGENIITIHLKPQESSIESSTNNISIFRLDFKAVIKTATGESKKVLIELQKAKKLFDVMRFRRYLGDNYRKEDDVVTDSGDVEIVPLPIITIYFLGFKLQNVPVPVLKVGRAFQNAGTGEIFTERFSEPFIDLLTHESYTIQIPRLKIGLQTRLEKILNVFNQEFKTDDHHKLNFNALPTDDPLVKRMIDRLNRAIASDEIRNQMDFEDEIDRVFRREMGQKDKIIEEKEKEIEESKKEILERDKEIEAKNKENQQIKHEMETLKKRLEDLTGKQSDK